MLEVDPAIPAEKLVETYFDLPDRNGFLSTQPTQGETEDVRQFINDMPAEVFKAIVSAFANAGLAKETNLSREVLLGTLLARLHKNYTVTISNGRVVISGERDGRPVSIFLDGTFPWDAKKNEP